MGPARRAATPWFPPWPSFAAGASLVVLASRAVVRSGAFQARPGLGGLAVTADLTLTTSLVAWATLVRTGRVSPRSLLVVASLGLAAASVVLPAQQGGVARLARMAIPAIELAVLGWAAWATARAVRLARARREDVPLEELARRTVREAIGPSRGMEAVVTELSLLGMALCSWRASPHVPAGARAFTVHERSGVAAAMFALALAGAGETIAAHVLLASWSARWAWIATGLAAYTAVWLVGDYRALVLRPVLLGRDALEIRIGLRWRASIPLRSIRGICAGPDPVNHPRCAVASPLGSPVLYLHLDGPVELEGPLGIRRRGDCLGLRVDDPAGLRRALLQRLPELARA